MSWRISCLCSCTGREHRKASSSEEPLCGGTTGMPLFKRPLALFLSRALSERRTSPYKGLWNALKGRADATGRNSPASDTKDTALLLLGCISMRSLLLIGNRSSRLWITNNELWEGLRSMLCWGLSGPSFFVTVRKRFDPFLKGRNALYSTQQFV